MIKIPKHAPAASSVSIFHQVLSETPLRKKNIQEPVSFGHVVPLQELKVQANI
jgi:hypothetical protein